MQSNVNKKEGKIDEFPQRYADQNYAIYHPKFNPMMLNDKEELLHFRQVLLCFFNYYNDYQVDQFKLRSSINQIPYSQKHLLKYDYSQRIEIYDECIKSNASFLYQSVMGYTDLFSLLKNIESITDIPSLGQSSISDINKIRITLKQLVRDWSKQGQQERDQCYKPIIEKLLEFFPGGQKASVLVPGAGLGRLVYDLARKGFQAQGNEFSYFMLLVSNFILNLTSHSNEFKIYPFVNNQLNRRMEVDSFEEISVPDEAPCEHMQPNDVMSMVAGEFIQVYGDRINEWDAIATCFFIDTSNNVLDYIDTIYKILKPKGYWINMGPLEYHFAKMLEEVSIELSWEEIKHYSEKIGFEFLQWEYKNCTYNHHHLDGKKLIYDCAFFVGQKKG